MQQSQIPSTTTTQHDRISDRSNETTWQHQDNIPTSLHPFNTNQQKEQSMRTTTMMDTCSELESISELAVGMNPSFKLSSRNRNINSIRKSYSNIHSGNVFFFGNDQFHHCLKHHTLSTPRTPCKTISETTIRPPVSTYFGASTDAQFTRHHPLIESNEIIKVASGDCHSLFLTRDHRVIVAGKNKNGQLGLYHFDPIQEPQYLEFVGKDKIPCPPIRNVYCGGDYSFIETMNHEIYSFGKNKIGQLGIGDCVHSRIAIPTRVHIQNDKSPFSSRSMDLSSSASTNSFSPYQISSTPLNSVSSTLVQVPCSSSSQIPLPLLPSSSSTCLFPGQSLPVKLISCGWQSTFILFENDHLYVCGDNSHQCHVPSRSSMNQNNNNQDSSPHTTTTSTSTTHTIKPIISPQRKLEKFSFQRIEIPNLYASSPKNSIKDIQVGLFHTGILMENGEVWISCPCCCSPIELERRKFKKKSFIDKNGKLLVTEYGNDLLKSFKIMHMAYLSTFLGTHNDVVYVSGINYCGSLGVGSSDLIAYKRFTESSLLCHLDIERIYGTNRTIIVTRQGHVYVCGSNCQGELCLNPLEYSSMDGSGGSGSSSNSEMNTSSAIRSESINNTNRTISSGSSSGGSSGRNEIGTNETMVVTSSTLRYKNTLGLTQSTSMMMDPHSTSPCPCGNDHCLRSCIATPQRVLFLENELKKRRNAKLEISCGSFHTIAYFTSTETRDMSMFYYHLYRSLMNDDPSTVDHNKHHHHGFSDLVFEFNQEGTSDSTTLATQKRSVQLLDQYSFLSVAPQSKKIKLS
ncbi:hypothetical protein C9374_002280 [Naegleria lovaniensis]|uniref:Uncharacterized protein n=1 Tax=Naegleria lovaniensis TaxID=51637 RepID=A0AA88GQI6_NAELO|nr:uncharacterized protein C9374_002280 [Naegleria lovaniensis]KAG2386536.1 hypothetical protein C9374_002280 [Naegleria lovaniensis]